jgi:hypothetical protein
MNNRCAHTGKVNYSKKDAQTFVNAHPERKLRKYSCECGHWHLTHQPLENRINNHIAPLKYLKAFSKLIAKP